MDATLTETSQVRVGLAVFVRKDDRFVMGERRGAHGANTWSVPGGHVEFGESWSQTAVREVLEETGMHITNVQVLAITNDFFELDNRHYATVWVTSDWVSGEPTITEPDKFIRQDWYTIDTLPAPLFEPCWTNLRQAAPQVFTSGNL